MHSLFTDLLYSAPHGGIGCGQKIFNLVKRCHQLLSGFLAKGDLPRVSRQSSLSEENGDYEVKQGSLNRSPAIYLTAEENPGKLS